MPEIIKPKENVDPITKVEEHQNMRAHLLMMLEAMQYKGSIKHMGNECLRELVEEQKLVFLRKLQAQNDRPQQT
jgi:hypothetical protein